MVTVLVLYSQLLINNVAPCCLQQTPPSSSPASDGLSALHAMQKMRLIQGSSRPTNAQALLTRPPFAAAAAASNGLGETHHYAPKSALRAVMHISCRTVPCDECKGQPTAAYHYTHCRKHCCCSGTEEVCFLITLSRNEKCREGPEIMPEMPEMPLFVNGAKLLTGFCSAALDGCPAG